MAWRRTSAGTMRRASMRRSTSRSDPLHEPHLEAMRERRMVRIRADAVLELPAELRREIEREALLAIRIARALGLERVALLRGRRGEVLQRGRQQQLDDDVLGRELVELHADGETHLGAEFHVALRHPEA